MAIGRTFQESWQEALRSLEIGIDGLTPIIDLSASDAESRLRKELQTPGADRIRYLADAFRFGMNCEDIFQLTAIDPWFIVQLEDLVRCEEDLQGRKLESLDRDEIYRLKQKGFSDSRLGTLLGESEAAIREYRHGHGVRPVYRRVDTCAAEFACDTA